MEFQKNSVQFQVLVTKILKFSQISKICIQSHINFTTTELLFNRTTLRQNVCKYKIKNKENRTFYEAPCSNLVSLFSIVSALSPTKEGSLAHLTMKQIIHTETFYI